MRDLEEEVLDLAHEFAKAILHAVLESLSDTLVPLPHREPDDRTTDEAAPRNVHPLLEKVTSSYRFSAKHAAVLERALELLRRGPMLSRDLQSHFPDRICYLSAMRAARVSGLVERSMTAQGKVYSLPSEDAS